MGILKKLGLSAYLGNERTLDELEGELKLSEQAVKHHIRDWKEQEEVIPQTKREIEIVKEKIRKERED